MDANAIRQKFIDFFVERGHLYLPSSSLVPEDPTLLTTSAGMVQFKPYFLGKKEPPCARVTTSQKCLRAVDIDEVGRTPRHHTFFEMLGNFSFGDYFKADAIPWAWELLTGGYGIPEERLPVTVYEDDAEAAEVWLKKVGVPKEKLFYFGEKDNYWPAGAPSKGPNGPCGPCSEIFYDYGEDKGCGRPGCDPSCDCDRFVEIWNLVFMQFERREGGKLDPLPMKNIDTGSGLERMAAVMQGVDNNFDTDLFRPIIKAIGKAAEPKYGKKTAVPYRVVADHIRGCAFLVADGVFPSNEGRGHLLRRILRRAANAGRDLGISKPFLADLVPAVVSTLADAYPEIKEKEDFVCQIISKEEQQYAEARKQGGLLVKEESEKIITKAKDVPSKKTIHALGTLVFRAYDERGLPSYESLKIILKKLNYSSDQIDDYFSNLTRSGFKTESHIKISRVANDILRVYNNEMVKQSDQSRAGGKMDGEVFADDPHQVYRDSVAEIGHSAFDGYHKLAFETKIVAMVADGQRVDSASEGAVDLILEKTPFYGEMGGQTGDTGTARTQGAELEITESFRVDGEIIVHHAEITKGGLKVGDSIAVEVEGVRRAAIARHHTATHLLHAALRKVLGEHVVQSGSYVGPDKLRFDFTHHSQVDAETLRRIEREVNDAIMKDLPVEAEETTFEEAKKQGVIALFGEKYGERVRAVRVGDESAELCGGTHVSRAGEIGCVIITDERAVGSNMRRVEALAGHQAIEYINQQRDTLKAAASLMSVPPEQVPDAVKGLQKNLGKLEKQMKGHTAGRVEKEAGAAKAAAEKVGETTVVAHRMKDFTMDQVLSVYDSIKTKLKSHAVLLGAESSGKAFVFIGLSKDVVKKGLDAGKLIREVAAEVGGKGGGQKDKARAGGKDPKKLPDAIKKGKKLLKEKLEA